MSDYLRMMNDSYKSKEIVNDFKIPFLEGNHVSDNANYLPLRQNWVESDPQEKGIVTMWYDTQYLHIYSIFEDSDIFSKAEGKNQATWQLGDVVELFFRPNKSDEYYEIHLTPSFATLEYTIPSIEAFRKGGLNTSDLTKKSFHLENEIQLFDSDEIAGWIGHIKIPLESLNIEIDTKGIIANFAVCRYNYNNQWGDKPELSSTCALQKLNFHAPEDWQDLFFLEKYKQKKILIN